MSDLHGDVQDSPVGRAYAQAVELYRSGQYGQAIARLGDLRDEQGAVGSMARFYEGMSHRALGLTAMGHGRHAEAETHLKAATQLIGTEADLSVYLARLYAKTNRPEACCQELDRAVASSPSPETFGQLARAQWQAGRRDEAQMTLQAALRRFPADGGLLIQLGQFHAAVGRYAEAQWTFRRAVADDCDNADAHYHLALVYAAQHNVAASVRAFQRAFDLRSDDLLIGYQLAVAARAAGATGVRVALRLPDDQADESVSEIAHLARFVAREPAFLDGMLSLPPSATDADLFGLLLGVVKTALRDHPDYADLRYYCSRILQRLDRIDEAGHEVRAALEINPSYVKALLHSAALCETQGAVTEAVDLLQRAIECGADYADVHFRLAKLLVQAGAARNAQDHLQQALAKNDRYDVARQELDRLAA
ncbi:MAG: tetratricopeptide repeat protein [Planctomycetota bacterium]